MLIEYCLFTIAYMFFVLNKNSTSFLQEVFQEMNRIATSFKLTTENEKPVEILKCYSLKKPSAITVLCILLISTEIGSSRIDGTSINPLNIVCVNAAIF